MYGTEITILLLSYLGVILSQRLKSWNSLSVKYSMPLILAWIQHQKRNECNVLFIFIFMESGATSKDIFAPPMSQVYFSLNVGIE